LSKPRVIFLEQLVAARSHEVPQQIIDAFDIRTATNADAVEQLVSQDEPACIIFDFDYPDRRRLQGFSHLKKKFPSIPVIMFTVQHSESLAVWAYRHGALDYFVKPAGDREIRDCVERIQKIDAARRSQTRRKANLFEPEIPTEIPSVSAGPSDRLAPAIHFVQQNFSERIYSDAMARLCGMSPTHFSRTFTKTYDLTFQEFVLRYRVNQACRQLQNPDVNVTNVAYNVGFSDPSYFTRVFKRYLGVLPTEYLAARRKQLTQKRNDPDGGEDPASTSQVVRTISVAFHR
jgi:AraC-like DNA-binding protein